MTSELFKLKIQLTIQGIDEIRDLSGKELIFGRSTSSNVYLNDPAFSRSHFKIYFKDNNLWIADLKSSNGTFINKAEIKSEVPVLLAEDDLISVHNSSTLILIKSIEFDGKLKEVEAPFSVDEISSDLSAFSQQLIAVANEKVEQVISDAHTQAQKIINDAIVKMKKDEEAFLTKLKNIELESDQNNEKKKNELLRACEDEISQKILANEKEIAAKVEASEKEIATFISIGKEKGLLEIDKYKNEKLEKINLIIIEENTKMSITLETAKQKQAEQIKQMDAILAQRGNDLSDLEKTFKDNFEKQNSEIENKLSDKKKELIAIELEFEQLKSKQVQNLEAHLESKKIEAEKKLDEIENKTKKTKEEFEGLYIQYEEKKKNQVDDLERIIIEKKNTTNELLELQNNIKSKKETYEEISSQFELANLQLQEMNKKLLESTTENDKVSTLLETAKLTLNELRNKYTEVNEAIVELNNKKLETNNEIKNLLKESNDLKEKIALTSQESSRFLAEQEKEIANVKNKFIQEKAKLDEDMRKLKESEEKRLQEMTTLELGRINKLKEDSLRLILELEDSITKELSLATSKVFANSVGVAKFKEIAPGYEKSIRDSLQAGVLKLLKNELSESDSSKGKKLSSNKSLKPMLGGALVSALVFGVIPFSIRYIKEQNDPIKQQLENEARRAAVPVKKYIPNKVDTLGNNFVTSVIFTNNYFETVSSEKYRSDLMKDGSVYLYKQWQIEEEKSIQAFAMIFSLVDAIHARVDKIDPDNEKKDLEKLEKLEKETMKKLEAILGNEVRVEAAIKFQTRFFQEYNNPKK